MDLDMQIKLFETGLDELDQTCDLINQVLEITLDDANDAEFTIIRYAVRLKISRHCPFHSQKEQPEGPPDHGKRQHRGDITHIFGVDEEPAHRVGLEVIRSARP
jgi:hypothetical protein